MMIEYNTCLSAAASFIVLIWVCGVGVSLGSGVVRVTRWVVTVGEERIHEEGEEGYAGEGEEPDVSWGEVFGKFGEW